jgi:hypothetical protein
MRGIIKGLWQSSRPSCSSLDNNYSLNNKEFNFKLERCMCKMNFDNLFDIVYYSFGIKLRVEKQSKYIKYINRINIKSLLIRSHLNILFLTSLPYTTHSFMRLSLQN